MADDIKQTIPSCNPADLYSEAGTMQYVLRNAAMELQVCLPAVVKSYNRDANVAVVIPCLNVTTTTNEHLPRTPVSVPVLMPSGGGFVFSFPLKEGDTGWLLINDGDISNFKKSRAAGEVNTKRIHTVEDSVFIPDRVSDFKASPDDQDKVILQTLEGKTRIAMSANGLEIETEELLNIKCKTAAIVASDFITAETKTAILKASDSVAIEGKTSIKGDVTITGSLTVSGSITAASADVSGSVNGGSVTAGGISLSSHVHGGVEPGAGTTGGPQ